MVRVILVNDTSIRQGRHFGVRLVCESYREQIARTGMRLVGAYTSQVSPEELEARRGEFDLVIVNGEGTIHHGRGANLVEIGARMPAVLVNCVYQDNPAWPGLKGFLMVTARESASAEAIRAQGVACEVVPDMIFASSSLYAFRHQIEHDRRAGLRGPTKQLGVTDNTVREHLRIGPLSIRIPRAGRKPRDASPFHYLRFLADHERMCIGRFHAACASLALGIPFTSWDSNTWKTEAMMRDAGAGHLHFSNRREALAAARSGVNLPEESHLWALGAHGRVEAMFDRIAEIARAQAARSASA